MMIGKVWVDSRTASAGNLYARHPRELPVENEGIGRIFRQAQLGLVASRNGFHDIIFRLQIVTDQHSHIDLVLDDENAGRAETAVLAAGFARPFLRVASGIVSRIPWSTAPGSIRRVAREIAASR